MTKVTWDREPEHPNLGRNGVSRSCGISAHRVGDSIWLEPINNRGEIGRARLVIPAGAAVVALIEALREA